MGPNANYMMCKEVHSSLAANQQQQQKQQQRLTQGIATGRWKAPLGGTFT